MKPILGQIKTKEIVTREYVEKAISKKNYRNNNYEEKLIEMIEKGVLLWI